MIILQQQYNAKLELTCSGGKVNVNFSHEIENTFNDVSKPVSHHSEVGKQSVKISQYRRFQKRAERRAEQAKVNAEEYKLIAENATKEVEQTKIEIFNIKEKAKEMEIRAEEAEEDSRDAYKMLADANITNIDTNDVIEKVKTETKKLYEKCTTLKVGDKNDFEGYKKVLKKMKKLTEIKRCNNCDCDDCGKYFWTEIEFKEHTKLKH